MSFPWKCSYKNVCLLFNTPKVMHNILCPIASLTKLTVMGMTYYEIRLQISKKERKEKKKAGGFCRKHCLQISEVRGWAMGTGKRGGPLWAGRELAPVPAQERPTFWVHPVSSTWLKTNKQCMLSLNFEVKF